MRTLKELETAHIIRTLELTGGNRTWAADILGLTYRGLARKLRRLEALGVKVPAYQESSRRIKRRVTAD